MSGDPLDGDITDPQTLNKYAYVRDNPVDRIDPLGTDGGGFPALDWLIGCNYMALLGNVTCGGGFGAPFVRFIDPPKKPSQVKPPAPKPNKDGCAAKRAASAIKGLINLAVGAQKANQAIASGVSSAGDGPVGFAGVAYYGIGAAGNLIAGVAQLTGAITGNTTNTGNFATGATTLTTALGYGTFISTGNMQTASSMATIESLGTSGFQGGMTGHLIDSVAGFGDLVQNAADFVGLNTSGTCH
jgi:hypothetical protein